MQKKERIVVICPGRGSYTSETLGYLKKPRAPRVNIGDFVADIDAGGTAIYFRTFEYIWEMRFEFK